MTREEAINEIKTWAIPSKKGREVLETLIPELRESEDERIRQDIVETIKQCTDILDPKNQKRMLAYLEKQKEQKPNPSNSVGLEQKPAERSIEDDHIIGFVYDLLNEIEWKDNWAMSKEECLRLLNNYNPQNPAEWSEEDERMRNQLIYDVEYHKKGGLISAKQNKATKTLYNEIEKCYDEKIAWLKSLRPQPHWKPSEEQMNHLSAAVIEAQRRHNESVNGFPRYHALKELYEQLLKL